VTLSFIMTSLCYISEQIIHAILICHNYFISFISEQRFDASVTGNLFKCHIARLAVDPTQEMLNLLSISALAYFTQ
jgi:hypothetical protein